MTVPRRIGRIPVAPKGQCRGCRAPVPSSRRTWCSQACVTEALIRKGDPNTVRAEVFRRDQGVCVACGLDTAQVQRVLRYLHGRRWFRGPVAPEDRESYGEAERWLYRTVTSRPFRGFSSHLWEADHIVPVVEGGGGCGLDGYRTLCLRCHQDATAALARRRARARREGAMPLLGASS